MEFSRRLHLFPSFVASNSNPPDSSEMALVRGFEEAGSPFNLLIAFAAHHKTSTVLRSDEYCDKQPIAA